MKVLSLFDGISCGRIALERAGIKIDKYFASEIDKYAIQVSKKNWPDIVHIGDVKNVIYEKGCLRYTPIIKDGLEEFRDTKIDLIIGGSPCQDLSIAKSGGKGLQGEKSGLFFEYVRLLKECKPKYFLLENVNSMKKADKEEITRVLLEVYPDTEVHMINSALVSAQNRKRLYWTNIPGIVQPEDKNILLRDVLEDIPFREDNIDYTDQEGPDEDMKSNYPKKAGSSIIWRRLEDKYLKNEVKLRIREKAYCLTARYTGASPRDYFEKNQRTLVIGIVQKPRGKNNGGLVQNGDKSPTINASRFQDNNFVLGQFRRTNLRIHSDQDKCCTLTSNMGTGGNNVPIIMGLAHRNRGEGKQPECNGEEKANSMTTVQSDSEVLAFIEEEYWWRKLTCIEAERIQTLDDNYTEGISNTQRYKSIGNAWSPDTVVVFFKKLKEILETI